MVSNLGLVRCHAAPEPLTNLAREIVSLIADASNGQEQLVHRVMIALSILQLLQPKISSLQPSFMTYAHKREKKKHREKSQGFPLSLFLLSISIPAHRHFLVPLSFSVRQPFFCILVPDTLFTLPKKANSADNKRHGSVNPRELGRARNGWQLSGSLSNHMPNLLY